MKVVNFIYQNGENKLECCTVVPDTWMKYRAHYALVIGHLPDKACIGIGQLFFYSVIIKLINNRVVFKMQVTLTNKHKHSCLIYNYKFFANFLYNKLAFLQEESLFSCFSSQFPSFNANDNFFIIKLQLN